ncbi:MAG: hypothetical protein ACMG57_02445 [Candidatus Dojkabacteria bacterium]
MPLETNLRLGEKPRISPLMPSQESGRSMGISGISKIIPSAKLSMFLIFVFQVILLILIVNPPNLLNQLNVVNIINDASKQANLPPTEVPVVGVIGDNKLLPSIDDIKKQNQFAADVYKDAQNGDYVLAYSSKMVIYRAGEKKVIYEGDTPATQQTKLQQAASDAVVSKAKEAGLIAQDSTETPGLSVVVDADKVKANNPVFYASAQKDDIIGTFSDSKLIVIYRPATKSIINSGKFSTIVQ